MKMYIKIINEQMTKENITTKKLAELSKMKETHIQDILQGILEPTLDELFQLVAILHLNINVVLGTSTCPSDDFLLRDETEIEINRIARKIPLSQRGKFIRAVNYLAECFESGDDKEDF